MNFCPYCGKELKSEMQFCPYCGKKLSANQFHNPSAVQSDHTQMQQSTTASPKTKVPSSKKLVTGLVAFVIIIALAAIAIINPFGSNFADDPDAIQKASESVVKLYLYDINGIEIGTGSGFAAFDKDIIITNHHCIEGDVYSLQAERADHSVFPIESVIAYDEEKDIAILRAPESNLTPLATGDSMNLKRGEKTVAIGSPIGFQQMVSTGIFSNYLNMETYSRILSTASISHGSSGGALFNNRGKVIGVTSGGYESGNDLYYSIPIHYVQELYNNRSPETEITLAEFYEQSEHPYSVDYLCANGNLLHSQTVVTYGYISGMDSSIYLVSSSDLVLNIDLRNNFDLESSLLLRELRSASYAIEVDTERNHIYTDDLAPNDIIVVEGTVMFYSSSDIRIIASKLAKYE